MNPERSKFIGLLTIPFFLLIIAILFFLNSKTVFEPPLVLPLLNTLFLGIIPVFIAIVAYRTYRTSGSVSVLLLGSGMLVFGLGSIAAGWLNGLPGGSNVTPTIHNTSVCIGSIFSLAAVLLVLSGPVPASKNEGVSVPLFVYGGIVAFVALLSFATVQGLVPPFFIQGAGPTQLRQVILSSATELYALASVLFYLLFTRKKDDFFFWFSIAFALVAIGLVAIFIQPAVGSFAGWTGRIAQYAGACFTYVAFISLKESATKEGITSPDLLARFFVTSETGYKILVETAPDAIVVIRDNRILFANDAALRMYGTESFDELSTNTVLNLLSPDERGIIGDQLRQIQDGMLLPNQEMKVNRRDGSVIDVSVRATPIQYLGKPAVIGILRDITDEKKAEEALQRQEQELQLKNSQLQALFDYSDASLVLFDAKPPYTVLAHNKYYQELWAEPFRSQGLVGKNIFDYVPGVEVQGVKEVYDEVVRTRQAKNLIGFPYDGMERGRTWWNWHLSPVIQGDKVVALAHMAFDVTREAEARIKAEEALSLLKASEDRLTLAQEAAGAGTWDWNVLTGEIAWGPRLYGLFGIESGKTPASFDIWNRLLHPDDRQGANARIEQALEQHTSLDSEYRIILPDGEIRWINARGQGVYNDDGKPVRMFGICIDITDRKRAEEAFRESEERYRMIVDTAQEGIVLTDPEGKIIFVNERFAQLMGYSSGELVGKPGLELAAGRERVSAEKKIDERSKGKRDHYEIWMLRKDGREICMLTSGTPIRDSDGRHLGNLGMYSDITERKRAEEALRESESVLRSFFDSPGIMRGIVEVIAEDDVLHITDNSTTVAFFGLTPEGMKNKKGSELGEPRDILRMWVGHYIESRKSGKPVTFEYRDKRGDKEAWLHATVNYLGTTLSGSPRFAYVVFDITERIRIEEDLRQSEERFRLALTHAPVSVAIQDRDLVFRWAYNQRTVRPEDVIGRTDTDLFGPEDAKHLIELKLGVLETGTAVREKLWLTSNGRRRYLDVYLEPLQDKPGHITGIGIATVDQTEQMQAEEALRESQVRTATILEGIADTFYSLDDQWRFTLVNPAAEKAPFGRRAAELIGKVIWELYPNLEGTPIHRHYLDAAEKRSLEHYVAQSPLNKLWYEVFMQGRKGGVDIYMRDITDRKVAEEALKESEEKYRGIVETANEGIIIVDAESQITYVNDKFADLLGYRPDELVGTSVLDFFEKEYVGPALAQREHRRQTGIRASYESRFIRKDGSSLWALVNSSPVLDKDGRFVGSLGMVTDITERRLAEQKVGGLLSEVREEKDRLSALINSISDEIWYADTAKKFTLANPSALEEFRLQFGDNLDVENFAKSLEVLRPDGSPRPVEEAPPLRALAGEVVRNEVEIIRTPGHGELRYRQVNATPVLDETGTIMGSVSVVRDITELKKGEETLRNTSQYLENLITYANAPIIVWDPLFRITRFNHAFERLTGRKASDVIGQRLEILFPEKFTGPAMDIIRTTTKGERLDVVEIPIIHVSGGVRTVLWNSATIFESDGKTVLATIAQGSDITGRKHAESVLHTTLERLNTLVSSMRLGILLVWEDRIEHTNQTFCDYFELHESPSELIGLTQGELIEKISRVYLHPDEEVDRIREIVRRGQPVTGEEVAMQKGRTYLRDFIPIVVDGKMHGRLWYHLDITDRKRAEEELLRRNEDLNAANEEIMATQEELQQSHDELLASERELRKTGQYLDNLITYANAPIVVWDPDYVITRFNHAFEDLTGRTAREIIGQRLEVLFPPQFLDASMEIIRKTVHGERLKVVEIPILNRSGEIRIVLWNSATLFEPDGTTIQSTIAQGNDITERKMTEAELEERNEELSTAIEELNEALKEKEVLLSEVHHRVKNNLTAFISLLSLESTYDGSPAGLALKKDLQNRARSMALIHETLYRTKRYSRVDMDVYMSTLVGQVVSSYESAKSVKTVVDAHGITLDLSRATPGGLIINELLTNSLKYAFPASFDCEMVRGTPCMIEVSLTEDDGAYILKVKDNGVGLPQDLDIASTRTLGLKLVNFLAKHQLKASIEVHPDEGADFRFRFRDKV